MLQERRAELSWWRQVLEYAVRHSVKWGLLAGALLWDVACAV